MERFSLEAVRISQCNVALEAIPVILTKIYNSKNGEDVCKYKEEHSNKHHRLKRTKQSCA